MTYIELTYDYASGEYSIKKLMEDIHRKVQNGEIRTLEIDITPFVVSKEEKDIEPKSLVVICRKHMIIVKRGFPRCKHTKARFLNGT